METVTDFIFLDSKITANGDCSHEIKRCLLLRRKAMTNLDSILKSRGITLPTKVHLVILQVVIELFNYRFFSITGWGIDLHYRDIEWFALDLLELTPKKDVLFIIGDQNTKVGNQETPGVTGKFGLGVQNETGQRLIEFCQENALVIANTLFQQHKRRLYTWISPDGQYQNQIDYIICSQRWRSSIQSAKTKPGADYGSDYELLIAKFRLKLKKVGKTTRPFRYDLNQLPYDYKMEVTDSCDQI